MINWEFMPDIQMRTITVKARDKKLLTKWTYEVAVDAKAYHGLDLESEIAKAMSKDITDAIDKDILADLFHLSLHTTPDFVEKDFDFTNTASVEEYDDRKEQSTKTIL